MNDRAREKRGEAGGLIKWVSQVGSWVINKKKNLRGAKRCCHARLLFSKSHDGKGANGSNNRPYHVRCRVPLTTNHAAKGSVFVDL